ncbi:pentatricopeptide repeat-containing protein At1g08070, chloroplastic-like [Macadamia integrifolia]|uniref:pentatricopeptide repeat-containing protein At1g08070, chloroplastic-like n=1 Tax=Macadamia integrifolia TaxID=60698 RepID=UPI001C4ED432|nr:pentatricopeptide repeat-containing protein At1g08070, chloroplastic-like [Macadamia integrifolia]
MWCLKSLAEFERMQKQLALSLLKNSEATKSLMHLKSLHVYLIRTGLHQSNFAIGNFVAHCAHVGAMSFANQVFTQMLEPNSFVWNTMIRGFQQNHEPQKALLLFRCMKFRNIPPDCFTFPFVIRACASLQDLRKGQCIHGLLFKICVDADVYIATSLVEFYAALGHTRVAHKVFDEIPAKDPVSWTTIMAAYVNQCGDMNIAHQIFCEMSVKDLVAWNTMIGGFVKIGDMRLAKALFDQAPVKDLLLYNTLLGGYAKHGEAELMLRFFHEMPERDLVSWNSVIGGLVQSKKINEAMVLFHQMQIEDLKPNEVTLVGVLSACAQVGALDTGRWIHSYIDRNGFGLNLLVGTALVDMYSKCGSLEGAQLVFERMLERDVVAWNAMIMGFSMNGQSRKALELFYQMRSGNVKPNEVTMIGVLCACTHAGLVDEGQKWFYAMHHELGIASKIEHYGCMVDLLGRAGLLKEAYEFIQAMPLIPHAGVWGALLGACKMHGNVELAEHAIKHLIELDAEDGGYLAIMSNIYANAGRWNDVVKVRELMKEKGSSKLRGCSSIEIDGEIHEFGVEENIHPRAKEIYKMIDEMSEQLRIAGHVASTNEVFFDVEEEEKEKALFFHSEKLAIAFGLIATKKGVTIRIVKNLRVCVDCHSAIKIISSIFDREIVVRDRSRFHHFKDGSCSCGDYW